MSAARTRDALAPVVAAIEAMRVPLVRAAAAHAAAAVLRQVETHLCWVRDASLRADRRAHPEHTVDRVAALTGIGAHTIVNARRINRPVKYRGRDQRGELA